MPRNRPNLQVSLLTLTSPAFEPGGPIPARHSHDGGNVSPALSWGAAPQDARSLALVCEDPDAGGVRPWVHWVLFNLSAGLTELDENVPRSSPLPGGAAQGRNDFGETGWGGPQPPSGTHHYYFRLYAVDRRLDLDGSATREDVLKAIDGHVVAEAELMGTFSA